MVDTLAVVGLDTVVLEVLGHKSAELGVEVVSHARGGHVHQQRVTAIALEGLGQLDADVARADYGHRLDAGVLQLLDDLGCVLIQLDLLDVLEVAALEARDDGQRTRGQHQLVVGFGVGGAVLVCGVDHLCVKVDALDRALHVDGGTLGLELLLGLVEETVGPADLPTDPQGHAAAQEAYVGVGIEGHDLVALVIVQNGVDGSSACMVGTHDDNLAHSAPLFGSTDAITVGKIGHERYDTSGIEGIGSASAMRAANPAAQWRSRSDPLRMRTGPAGCPAGPAGLRIACESHATCGSAAPGSCG